MHHRIPVCKLPFCFYSLLTACILSTTVFAAPTISSDWPQFQGPDRNGISPENNLARTWPTEGPKELWSTALGDGYSGPAVRDGEVYIVDRIGELQDVLRCFSLETGEELWNCAFDAPGKVSYPGSRTTPTVSEKYVYLVGVMGNFYCVDRSTHKPAWSIDLIERFALGSPPRWGIAQAPVLYEDLVLIAPQSNEISMAAFDQKTGELRWSTPRIAKLAYTSPVIHRIHGQDQAIMAMAAAEDEEGEEDEAGKVVGVSLKTGTVLWTYSGWSCDIPIPFPTLLPDNKLFITGGYEAGSAMIQIHKTEEGYTTEELFKFPDLGSQIHQPILYKGHLYLNNNENSRKEGLTCMSLDGTVKWRSGDTEGLPIFELGNLIMVDDMILNVEGKKGTLHLIAPSETGYSELASAQILTSRKKKYWAPMAVSQGKLLVRSQDTLRCLDLRNP